MQSSSLQLQAFYFDNFIFLVPLAEATLTTDTGAMINAEQLNATCVDVVKYVCILGRKAIL